MSTRSIAMKATARKLAPVAASVLIMALLVAGQLTAFAADSDKLQNPLKGVNSIGDLFYTVAQFAYNVSYAIVAFFLIVSGFKFVKAQGNPEELKDAKKTFQYTIVGAVLLIGANVITEVVRTLINQFSTNQV